MSAIAAGQGTVFNPGRSHHPHYLFIRNGRQIHSFQTPFDQPGQLSLRQGPRDLDAFGQVFQQFVLPAHIGGAD